MRDEINHALYAHLHDVILSPESGVQKIRRVLAHFGMSVPALYDLDPDGDEIVIDVDNTSEEVTDNRLYVIYYLTDDKVYDFYAELTDEQGIDDIMSDDEDEDEDDE
jgi:hypothetical protein